MTTPSAGGPLPVCEVCGEDGCGAHWDDPMGAASPGEYEEAMIRHWRLGYERLLAALDRRGEEERATVERKFHAQRAKVQAAHLAFHETGLWHGPEEEFDPAAQIRILAAALKARGEEERAKAVREARFAPLGDNHHNAAACPYCGDLLTKARAEERAKALEEAARKLDAWQTAIDESVGPHGTLTGASLVECIGIAARGIRSLAAAPSGDAKGTRDG